MPYFRAMVGGGCGSVSVELGPILDQDRWRSRARKQNMEVQTGFKIGTVKPETAVEARHSEVFSPSNNYRRLGEIDSRTGK
jgi:hypothetical protein